MKTNSNMKSKMSSHQNYNILSIVILGICIHVLLLITVFDTYFQSPLEHGMMQVKSTITPRSKRLLLFVADGLRAQAIFDENEARAPFLTSVKKSRGSWGISHTRVPTESRPGHVAILAGIFEDPSAIFKGWKHNPVDFDSVINQSTNAWCIGSPDIVPIFNKDERQHVHIHSYDSFMQDFGKADTTILDSWVFERTKFILDKYKETEFFNQTGNVFFLHLLGLDTAGHGSKPHSENYIRNIKFVDEQIEEMEKLFEEIFHDKLTSYVFTSDHGMTDWGSHGSGLDTETFTPIIVWGSGVNVDPSSRDIKQIDIAPLLASLIGINYPNNNLGKLPINYLNGTDKEKLYNFLTNIHQVFEIFNVKQQKIEKSTLYYKPYKHMTVEEFDKNFSKLWYSNETFDIAVKKCDMLFNELLKAIDYYHNYFMSHILFSVSTGLIFWIIYLSTFLFSTVEQLGNNHKYNYYHVYQIAPLLYNILVLILCILHSFSFLYYIYFLFPGTMLFFLLYKLQTILHAIKFNLNARKLIYSIYFVLCIIVFIFGFQYRIFFSVMMVLISFSIFLSPENSAKIEKTLKVCWISVCLILAIFPLLPLMFTKFQIVYFVIGFVMWQLFSCFIVTKTIKTYFHPTSNVSFVQKQIFRTQKFIFTLSFLNTLIISFEMFENNSVSQYLAWLFFLISLSIIPFSVNCIESKIYTIIFAFGPFYLMTTMSYELIFLTFYCILLTLWMNIEVKYTSKMYEDFENFRKCVIFVSLILIGFFGTGNIASLNSFDPMWVRCFLTVFSPFLMTILIFIKLVLPFLYTACVFRNIILKTGMDLTKSFCVILLISDVMVFYFLYQIKNVGSWLEIGTSLSHFIVVECLTIGIMVLYFVAYLLTTMKISENLLRRFGLLKYVE